ncbi:MAG: methyl-accepting chemotaxis protein [Anaerolineae bacterium]
MINLKNLKVRSKLLMLVALSVLGLSVFGVYAYTSMSTVEVNGPIYTRIVQGKDVVADILPPPEYIIESYLNALQLINAVEAKADQSTVNQLIEQAKTLRTAYEERHAYWAKALSDGTLKQTLVTSSYEPAMAFFNARDVDFLPAIQAGDLDKAKTIVRTELQPKYEEHRAVIDKVVTLANELNAQEERDAAQIISQTTTLLIAIGVIVGILSATLGIVISNGLSRPLTRTVEMIQEMGKGHLGLRLKMDRKDEIGVMATTLDQFADDLQTNVIGTMQKIAAGDLSANVAPKDAQDEISPVLMKTTDSLRGLVAEANLLTKAAVDGRLATRGNVDRFGGAYRDIVRGVNDTLDAVIGPLNVAAEYVDRISKGDIPAKIVDKYNGDFNEIKNNLNTLIDTVHMRNDDINMLINATLEGRLAVRADATKYIGENGKMIKGINAMLDAVIGPLNVAADYVKQIAQGDMPPLITSEYKGDFNQLKNNLNLCIEAVIKPLRIASDYVARISRGDLPQPIVEQFNGKFNGLRDNLNACLQELAGLVADISGLSQAALQGQLTKRADAAKHQGDFRKIVEGVNATLDAVIAPIDETSRLLAQVSHGDLSVRPTGHYGGDFALLQNSLTTMLNGLTGLATQTQSGSATINSAAAQILAASTEQASSTREQASAVNQITATVQEIKAAAEQVVHHAQKVAQDSDQAAHAAQKGVDAASASLSGMHDIKERVEAIAQNILALSMQAQQIGDIIDSVSDIAGQSNILALNAAIEAAQAGEAGRSFRVVADEVRSLAAQSRQAAAQVRVILGDIQKATNLAVMATEQGTKGVTDGIEMVSRTAQTINELADLVRTTSMATQQIVASVDQQTIGLDQIAIGMADINQASQQTAAGAQQSQRAAQDLSDVASQFKGIIAQYRI